ncbi:coenzyme F420-0:L-glutamate ligase [Brachybacterium sp. EF45031]|uniref:coenzyme F420-0:L-glutamate ligase n=1 Tax=Brachybacterium sillae TaxID=2810536 RepID=UPI00217E63AC|nr:coenzyme F420-0:L-glutamate ligase [Brachybacterium sillae]MCS6711026.1 coenzyme F420-0:L-glutamate ligase [Brachybacterium sillae]
MPSVPRHQDGPSSPATDGGLHVIPVTRLPEVSSGMDLGTALVAALHEGVGLHDGDVVCVSTKIVSKARGLVVDPAQKDAALRRATTRLVARRRHGSVITSVVETVSGPVMAAAGIDASNSPNGLLTLPEDPDAEAATLRQALEEAFGVRVGVVLTDTVSRIWRFGASDIALGASGLAALQDLRGTDDTRGRRMIVTVRALADECAAAADLVKGKTAGVPAAVLRGLPGEVVHGPEVSGRELNRVGPDDWFRRPSLESVWHALGIPLEEEPVAQMDPEADEVRLTRALDVASRGVADARLERVECTPTGESILLRIVPVASGAAGWVAAGALRERVLSALRAEEFTGPLPPIEVHLASEEGAR